MRRASLRWTLLATVALLGATAPAGRPWAERWKAETAGWRVETNAGEKMAGEIANRLESLRASFCETFAVKAASAPAGKKILACLFRTNKEYRENVPNPDMASHSGYYDPERNACYTSSDGAGETFLLHEAGHALAANLLGNRKGGGALESDGWAIEAVAAYCESLQVGKDGKGRLGDIATMPKDMLYRTRLGQAKECVQDGRWEPMEAFVAMGEEAFRDVGKGGKGKSWQRYDQAVLILHYLLHGDGGRHKAAVPGFLNELYSGRARPGAFERHFKTRPADLEPKVKAFALALPIDLEKEEEEEEREEERREGEEGN